MNNKIYINGRFLTQNMTGVQRVAYQVSKSLKLFYKEELIFLCPPEKIKEAYKEQFNIITVGTKKGHLWEQIDLPLFLKKNKATILVNFCNTAPIFFSNNIVVIHDMAVKHNSAWFDWKFSTVYKLLFHFNIKHAKKIITDSVFSKNEILKFYPKTNKEKIKVIYLASFITIKEEIQFRGNYFLAINSLDSRKNIDTIIKSFETLDVEKYKLKIVGGENKKIFGSNEKSNNSNIEYLGFVSDTELIKLIQESKALINASLYEGFGLPPLEAMSMKTPCILSRIDVYEELYGTVALFFKPDDSKELSNKVIELFSHDQYDTISEKSYLHSLQFSWEKTSAEYIKIIEKHRIDEKSINS